MHGRGRWEDALAACLSEPLPGSLRVQQRAARHADRDGRPGVHVRGGGQADVRGAGDGPARVATGHGGGLHGAGGILWGGKHAGARRGTARGDGGRATELRRRGVRPGDGEDVVAVGGPGELGGATDARLAGRATRRLAGLGEVGQLQLVPAGRDPRAPDAAHVHATGVGGVGSGGRAGPVLAVVPGARGRLGERDDAVGAGQPRLDFERLLPIWKRGARCPTGRGGVCRGLEEPLARDALEPTHPPPGAPVRLLGPERARRGAAMRGLGQGRGKVGTQRALAEAWGRAATGVRARVLPPGGRPVDRAGRGRVAGLV